MCFLDSQQDVTLSFYYGEEKITFYRKTALPTARITIEIDMAQRIIAYAPASTSDTIVIEAVKKNARWISQQLSTLKKQNSHVTPRQYISGESHFYLGRRYQLKIFPLQAKPIETAFIATQSLDMQIKDEGNHLMPDLFESTAEEKGTSPAELSAPLATLNHSPIADLFDPAHIALVDQLKKQQNPSSDQWSTHSKQRTSNNKISNSSRQQPLPTESVERRQNLLEIYTRQMSATHIATLLKAWYQAEAQLLFPQRLQLLIQRIEALQIIPQLALRWMQNQWSEYRPERNTLILNTHLIKADQEIIDYVILCELCQLIIEPNSGNFQRHLTRYCPKWRTIKARLEQMAGYYLQ